MAREDFRKQYYPHTWDGGTLSQSTKSNRIEAFKPAARIAVKHMAEAAKHAYQYGRWVRKEDMDKYLQERGLVPANEPM